MQVENVTNYCRGLPEFDSDQHAGLKWSLIVNYLLILSVGNCLHVGVIRFELYGGDPQKRGLDNRLLSIISYNIMFGMNCIEQSVFLLTFIVPHSVTPRTVRTLVILTTEYLKVSICKLQERNRISKPFILANNTVGDVWSDCKSIASVVSLEVSSWCQWSFSCQISGFVKQSSWYDVCYLCDNAIWSIFLWLSFVESANACFSLVIQTPRLHL